MSLLIRTKRPRLKLKHKAIVAFLLIGGLTFLWHKITETEPVQPVQATSQQPTITVNPVWPKKVAAAAIGAEGYGILAKKGTEEKRPIASISKVITALALLEKYPIKANEPGPSIPITAADEQLWRDYASKNGTVVLVKDGVPITLRDALEAILLPSANNVADTAAIWAFGSLEEYHNYANDMLQRLGLQNTTVGSDASGFNPDTQSTASDLVRIGELALKNPVIAKIVRSHGGDVPTAGPIPNHNGLVNKHGFTGIKPGNTDEAGSCSLFSKKQKIGDKEVNLVGVILGADDYEIVTQGAVNMFSSVKKELAKAPVQ